MKLWCNARPVQVRFSDRAVEAVGPVDVAGVDGHPAGERGAGDEALVRARPVHVRLPERAREYRHIVGPVDVVGVDRESEGPEPPLMKLWFTPVPSRFARPIVPGS